MSPPIQDMEQQDKMKVIIPAALSLSTHVLYSICVQSNLPKQISSLPEWTVNRRYSQFLALKASLLAKLHDPAISKCPSCVYFLNSLAKFRFPKKKWQNRSNSVVRKRVSQLQDFLQLLISHGGFNQIFDSSDVVGTGKLPRCQTCVHLLQREIEEFLIRGARKIGSTASRIRQVSMGVGKKLPKQENMLYYTGSGKSNQHKDSSFMSSDYTSSESSNPVSRSDQLMNPDCPFGKCKINDKCSHQNTMKGMVLNEQLPQTYEEKKLRITTMWEESDLYGLEDDDEFVQN